jgi:hypothetical protein
MSAYSGAFGTQAGYNQSGGGYYLVISSIIHSNFLGFTPGSGSGGAATTGTFAPYSTMNALAGTGRFASSLTIGNLIKDMGRTVVSAGRAFRKFQLVGAAQQSTGGVLGTTGGASSDVAGYYTGYLEVAAPNGGGAAGSYSISNPGAPAPGNFIARV